MNIEKLPYNSEGEDMVILRDTISSLADKVAERRLKHPEEGALESIRRVVHSSSRVKKESWDEVRQEVSFELEKRRQEELQRKIDAKHDAHWTVRAGLDD